VIALASGPATASVAGAAAGGGMGPNPGGGMVLIGVCGGVEDDPHELTAAAVRRSGAPQERRMFMRWRVARLCNVVKASVAAGNDHHAGSLDTARSGLFHARRQSCGRS
jgi:hypothetical protein